MIGLVGGYGTVGAHAARLLRRWQPGALRIGGRRGAAARLFAAGLAGPSGPAEAAEVDVEDDASLAAFAAGCAVVVNCAGPSYRTTERVALAALRAGADHVDAGGDEVVLGRIEQAGPGAAGRRAVLSAGALPGLSGLLPRWLAARDLDTVHGLTAYTGVLDRFTPAGAADYLHGVAGGASESLAAWEDGGRRSGALSRHLRTEVPFFPGEVSVLPYLDAEGERLARDLSLTRGRWYSVVDGRHLQIALDRAGTLEPRDAEAALCHAAALDVAGRTPYVTFLVQLDGMAGGREVARTALLRGRSVSELTGAVAALAALAALRGDLPPGAHQAATVLNPRGAVEALAGMPGLCELTVLDTTIDELRMVEEGAL